jgi:uncharacterized protein (DUF1697 family)
MKYLALLRGINVGGNSLINMADLRKVFEALGFTEVSTYIASGNVLFTAGGAVAVIVTKVERALEKRFGMPLRIVVRSAEDVKYVVAHAPAAWKSQDLRKYVAFIKEPVKPEDVAKEISVREGVDALEVGKGVLYMSTKMSGLTKSGFTKIVGKKFYRDMTMRNFTTVTKLAELLAK